MVHQKLAKLKAEKTRSNIYSTISDYIIRATLCSYKWTTIHIYANISESSNKENNMQVKLMKQTNAS